MIAAPAFVGLDVMKEDILRRAAVLPELLSHEVFPIVIRHIDANLLAQNWISRMIRARFSGTV